MLVPDDWGGKPPRPGVNGQQVSPGTAGAVAAPGNGWWRVLAGLVVGF